jgi:7-cyano-7-deazaguanine synthase in queuosine biosynthesis
MTASSFQRGADYRYDSEQLASDAEPLNPLAEDLIEIACNAYLQDRSVPRGAPDTDAWTRDLTIAVCARRPTVWTAPAVLASLTRLLEWLTADRWSIAVVSGPAMPSTQQLRLPVDRTDRVVSLFSGGLDAVAGAALHMHGGAHLLGVAVETNTRMCNYQRATASALRQVTPGSFRLARVPCQRIGSRAKEDASRRTRGFLFLVSGWVAARASGTHELLVFENGIGAINLPYTRAQHDVMTSRAVHPRTLELAAALFSLLDGETFTIRNPYLSRTKGEMVRGLPEVAAAAVMLSESCDNAAAGRNDLSRRCGRCSSCLLRRVSLHAAQRADWDPRPYLADTYGEDGQSAVQAMLWQVARAADAIEAGGHTGLLEEFPELADVSMSASGDIDIVRLLSNYVEEWRTYPHPLTPSFLGSRAVA